jgi:ubiquitin carboxyl-terminal hydrolase 8
MEKYVYATNGLSGIKNIGNTCYMNSCLQILAHTYEMHDEVRKLTNIRNTNSLFIEWIKLNNQLWKSNTTITPTSFHNELQTIARKTNNNFVGYNQNDASEFLIFIMDIFHETCKLNVDMKIKGSALNKLDEIAIKCYEQFVLYHKENYSLIVKLFYYMSVTNNICISDGRLISQSFQSNFMLDLPIPNKHNINIYDCLNLHFQDTTLLKENGVRDEKTNIQHDVVQKTSLWNAPPILIICFKRFTYDGRKNNKMINFPIDKLDIQKYVSGYKTNNMYELYGICNHSGVADGGHYTSYVKTYTNDWYLFNDTCVTLVQRKNISETIITSKAYCLFYRNKN